MKSPVKWRFLFYLVLMNEGLPIKGAKASAIIYSIVQTAKLNNLSTYYYLDYLLTELPKLCAKAKKGNIDTASLDQLLPWSETLPENCRKPRR